MRTVQRQPTRERLSRRGILKCGALAAAGLNLADLLRLEAAAGNPAAAGKSVILLWMHGGPSQLDTFDPKPAAPAEIRGEFKTISTALPGVAFCEHLPQIARLADRLAIVRSLQHRDGLHESAIHWVLTGYGYPGQFNPTDQRHARNPSAGSVVAYSERAPGGCALPYVKIFKDGGYSDSYQGPVYLGRRYDPLEVGGDIRGSAFQASDPFDQSHLQAPALAIPAELTIDRVQNRRALLTQLDDARRKADGAQSGERDVFQQRAFDLLTSRFTQEAFDLSREHVRTRERYGKHLWGQGALLARRLVESGVRFVTVNLHGDPPALQSQFSWDTHVDHFPSMKNYLLPVFDQLASALIEDLCERGIYDRVLVVAVGEFGRTPKVFSDGRAGGVGRAHWPQAFSALVAGGGMRIGQVVGATDPIGAYPTSRPFSPQDLLATIYRFLGIDHHAMVPDELGRPRAILPDGEPIRELIS